MRKKKNNNQTEIKIIKSRLKAIINLSMVVKSRYESNILYFKRYQKGVKKPLIGVKFNELRDHIERYQGVKIPSEYCVILRKLQKLTKKRKKQDQKAVPTQEIDTLELTPLEKIEEEIIDELLRNGQVKAVAIIKRKFNL